MAKSVQLLEDEKNYIFLSLLSVDKKLEIKKMSRFERFALLCDSLSVTLGSRLRKEFLIALSCDLGCEVPVSIGFDRDVQKAVWRTINGDSTAYPNIDKTTPKITEETINSAEKISVGLLDSILENASDVSGTLEEFINSLSKYDGIALDMTDFVYCKPDEYHSGLVYDKLTSATKCSTEEKSLLVSWIICRIAMKKRIRLYLVANRDLNELKKLLMLLEQRHLYPDVNICFDNFDFCDEISRICLEAEQKNVSSEIIISKDTGIKEILCFIKALAYELPLTRISICDFLASSEERERFNEAIKQFIKGAEEI